MADRDRTGAALFHDWTLYTGAWKTGTSSRLVIVNGLRLDRNNSWKTSSNGTVVANGPDLMRITDLWLRFLADIRPGEHTGVGGTPRNATLSWSRDGVTFSRLRPDVQMNNEYEFLIPVP